MTFTTDDIARICHEANRALCASFGDTSQPSWAQAPKSSHRAMAESIEAVRSGEVKGPAALHQRWVDHKISEGWKYGPSKDGVEKTHPLLVPYAKLKRQDQAKDLLFFQIARGLV